MACFQNPIRKCVTQYFCRGKCKYYIKFDSDDMGRSTILYLEFGCSNWKVKILRLWKCCVRVATPAIWHYVFRSRAHVFLIRFLDAFGWPWRCHISLRKIEIGRHFNGSQHQKWIFFSLHHDSFTRYCERFAIVWCWKWTQARKERHRQIHCSQIL